jgi:hypothetical protein
MYDMLRLEEQGLPDIKPSIMVVTRLIPQVCH